MKVDITKRQLEAIQEICTTVDAMTGNGGGDTMERVDGTEVDWDTSMLKELKIVARFFEKNGYKLDLE